MPQSPHFVQGTVTGTGSAINVPLGFAPDYVKVWNPNDGGSLWPTMEWVRGFTSGHSFKTLRVVDNGSTGNATDTKVTSNGITEYTGSIGAVAKGFTIGADSDLNVNGEVLYYIAMANP